MTPEALTETMETKRDEQCVHYWVIDPPEGPVSRGTCKICGAEKEFRNFLSYSPWDNQSPSLTGFGNRYGSEIEGGDEGDLIFIKEKAGKPRRKDSG